MKRLKKMAVDVGVVVGLVVGLVVWSALSWQIVLVIVAALALWLVATQRGRQTLAVAGVGLTSLPQRWGASAVIVTGIAGVVVVLVAVLAMAAGFQATLAGSANAEGFIVLRSGAASEANSSIAREQAGLVAALPGIAAGSDGKPLVSAELTQVVNLPNRSDGSDASVSLRGVGEAAWTLRPQIRLVEGRAFTPGTRELVVGQGALARYAGIALGDEVELGQQRWRVVGVFAAGDSHDSELWADNETVASTYRRPAWQALVLRLSDPGAVDALRAAFAADPRLKLDAQTLADYYAKQSAALSALIQQLGTAIGLIMAIGAIFGALNTMYTAVARRAREIATLRALGFGGMPVVLALMLETLLLALLGGVAGGLLAWLVFNGYSVSTLGSNFSQVMFQFQVSPELLWNGLKWALGIGLVGGLFPALRAARLPVTQALR